MGVKLGPLMKPFTKFVKPEHFSGRIVAVDALPALYEMLAMIRDKRGLYLVDSRGRVTSHLVGLFHRLCRMLVIGIRPAFVFDGPPHKLKLKELEMRRREKEKFQREYIKAVLEGRYEDAKKLGKRAMYVNDEMIRSARRLLTLMGVPVIDAPHDAEAQAAHMVAKGDAYTVASRDWDALVYGSPRLVMDLKLSPNSFYKPRLYVLDDVLSGLGLTREQFVDLAILLGTDFNPGGFPGVGIKRALELIRRYGSLEEILKSGVLRWRFESDWREIRELFLNPPVAEGYKLEFREPDYEGVVRFLVDEYSFNKSHVLDALSEVRRKLESRKRRQTTLEAYL